MSQKGGKYRIGSLIVILVIFLWISPAKFLCFECYEFLATVAIMGSTVALYAAYEHRALSSSDSERQSGELVE